MRRCEDVRMWRCEDVRMRRYEDEKVWRWEDVRMRRCEDEKMRRWEDAKMRRCEDEKMWRWEDVKMRRREDEKTWRWEDVLQTPTIGRTLRSDALGEKQKSSVQAGYTQLFPHKKDFKVPPVSPAPLHPWDILGPQARCPLEAHLWSPLTPQPLRTSTGGSSHSKRNPLSLNVRSNSTSRSNLGNQSHRVIMGTNSQRRGVKLGCQSQKYAKKNRKVNSSYSNIPNSSPPNKKNVAWCGSKNVSHSLDHQQRLAPSSEIERPLGLGAVELFNCLNCNSSTKVQQFGTVRVEELKT